MQPNRVWGIHTRNDLGAVLVNRVTVSHGAWLARPVCTWLTSQFERNRRSSSQRIPCLFPQGIQGLTKLLNDNAPGCVKETKFESYFGRKIAVDASNHIYQYLAVVGRTGDQVGRGKGLQCLPCGSTNKGWVSTAVMPCSQHQQPDAPCSVVASDSLALTTSSPPVVQLLTNEAGETTSHLQGMFFRTVRMLEAGIQPVYIFDGKPPELKKATLAQRGDRKDEAEANLKQAQVRVSDSWRTGRAMGLLGHGGTSECIKGCGRHKVLAGSPLPPYMCGNY